MEVGYKLEEHIMHFTRKVFLKFEDPLERIPDEQKDPVFLSALEVFIEKGQDIPSIQQINFDTVLITQDFMPLLLTKVR